MKFLPINFDVTLALADVLRAADLPYAAGFVDVSSPPNVPKRSYRLVPSLRVSGALSSAVRPPAKTILGSRDRVGHQRPPGSNAGQDLQPLVSAAC